ncbi:ATP-binding cassette domain-containing protein [Clostridium botulinum]|uniref:UvrABC system protein A n=1 Tax=Clostridium botulinum (strain Hall / ATCC 3502 / NCTC 13319 / Type A) TaxID=441771 RepID=A5HZQ4_CLOBH|nr:excinuclease ABC subunit UvrA [Clostridium botulinum]ABS33902.1 putative drug resistance ABC transporter, ATP-binding protein [Clostridium botulinum A str. ATCC 19397]ABS37791.1 putative drug resistance ABC transporter, ATP-binding protein [Clostridium botulinum A str. Hall]AWB16638.1 excinuclease ABC subunit UvrA [Clostridium botulinum]EGT5613993.1 excinuclease ABC subunit UvrA [Clostridium botulinum]EGT5620694.1 excinuclease ABC subunit UvrA [Clostridium botulinum]
MEQEFIVLKGCKENNLKDISLNIPKRKITIFTGVSGSGKSSIVFETVAKEAQRQLNETFTAFIRNFLPKYGEVKADHIENLSTPIIIDQSRLGGNSRSTLGTITDINSFLRALYSRFGSNYIGKANMFSFNDINGMCPECQGLGKKLVPNMEEIFDKSKSLNEGAILLSGFGVGSWHWKIFAQSGYFDNDKKICDYSEEELDKFLYGGPDKIKIDETGGMNITYEGLLVKFNRLYLKKEGETSEAAKKKLNKLLIEDQCPACGGKRLHQRVYGSLINGYNIADLTSMQIDELVEVVKEINDPEAEPLVKGIIEKLNNIIDIGLGYLTLDRETSSLSGGESQRIKMVKHLNSNLVDLMYIFDEPSIGLHPRDVHKLNNLLKKLRDKGNTVIVVEHDPDVIKIADHIIDVGPKAGKYGGEIVYEGTYENLLKSGTLTGNALNKSLSIKEKVRDHKGYLKVVNCNKNNLKNISVTIPKGVLTVVTGVAGSGKSTLIKHEFLKQNKNAVLIDQSPVSANSRSSLATYSGIMDNIRKAFAKANGVNASLFSSNSKGACENCNGSGIIETNLAFMENIKSTCDVCEGKKYKKEVLDYKLHGENIIEVLEMSVSDAIEFFNLRSVKAKLQSIEDMGIGYLTLGQTLDTLSGGECQRLKLASELHNESSIYILDEPTTGLHIADIEKFINIVENIVDSGNTVIIIEHNVDIIKRADWIIDMGPDGGTKGGEIIFEGTPKQLHNCQVSLTAKYI